MPTVQQRKQASSRTSRRREPGSRYACRPRQTSLQSFRDPGAAAGMTAGAFRGPGSSLRYGRDDGGWARLSEGIKTPSPGRRSGSPGFHCPDFQRGLEVGGNAHRTTTKAGVIPDEPEARAGISIRMPPTSNIAAIVSRSRLCGRDDGGGVSRSRLFAALRPGRREGVVNIVVGVSRSRISPSARPGRRWGDDDGGGQARSPSRSLTTLKLIT